MNKDFSFSKCIILSVILFVIIKTYAKENVLKIAVHNIPDTQIYLASYYGDETTLIDSATMAEDSSFQFKLDGNIPIGLYRLIFGNKFLDIIINHENINLISYYNNPAESIQVSQSDENRLFYKYLQQQRKYNLKMSLLGQILAQYPRDDSFYTKAEKQMKKIQQQHEQYIHNIIKKNPSTYCVRIAKNLRLPIPDSRLPVPEQKQYVKNHFLDHADFSDTLLLRSNVLTKKVFAYLGLFGDIKLNKEKQQQAFIEAVDNVLEKTQIDDKMNTFFINYLTKGFEKLGLDDVVNYITKHYALENACINEERKKKLKTRLEHSKILEIGKKPPEIETVDINGKRIKLSEINTEKLLVIFWASWCPYCIRTLPDINEIYKNQTQNKFEVLAISLDTNITDWKNTLKKENYTWINCIENKGWDSKTAQDYYLFAIPTIFILDNRKKVLVHSLKMSEITKTLSN